MDKFLDVVEFEFGAKSELKFALESYWQGQSIRDELQEPASDLRRRHWKDQAALDLVPIGDFSFYDQVLDMSFTLGNLLERARDFKGDHSTITSGGARGRSAQTAGEYHDCGCCIAAGEMIKWFDTNYHYIVPEFTSDITFALDASRMLAQFVEAKAQSIHAKPVLIGPLTYLALGKSKDDSDKLVLLPRLLSVYAELLEKLTARVRIGCRLTSRFSSPNSTIKPRTP